MFCIAYVGADVRDVWSQWELVEGQTKNEYLSLQNWRVGTRSTYIKLTLLQMGSGNFLIGSEVSHRILIVKFGRYFQGQ